MFLPRLAIDRPVATLMAVLMVVLLGVISLTRMPIDLLPRLEFPVIAVMTDYRGAGPHEVEAMVSRPIEGAVSGVGNVRNVSSVSREGSSLVLAEFQWGTNMDAAATDVREKVDLVLSFLPAEVGRPMIIKADPAVLPIMQVAFSGSDDLSLLTSIARDLIRARLERIDGVAAVTVVGGVETEIGVAVEPRKLQGYGLNLPTIVQALRLDNLNLPGGHIEEAGRRLVVRTLGQFKDVEDVANVMLPIPGGGAVALGDVARVARRQAPPEEFARLNGRPSVGLFIQKQAGANTVQVAGQVHRALKEIASELPPGVEIVTAQDQAEFINAAIRSTAGNALAGGALAVAVLLVFLQSLPSTVAIAAAIPISVVATFILLYFSGLTLNLMSLGGLALGVGMLVDNAIVVLESIFRHREKGEDAREAALVGAREVGAAVSASTLTTVVVFLPILFIGGFAAQLFRELALTVSFSLFASLVVSLSLVPMLASRLPARGGAGSRGSRAGGRVRQFLSDLEVRYRHLLGVCLARRRVVSLAAASAFLVSLAAVPFIGLEFIPELDRREIEVEVSMPAGTVLSRTDEVARQIEREVFQRRDVEAVFTSVGGGGRLGLGALGGGRDTASVMVRLEARRRGVDSTRVVTEELRRVCGGIPGARVSVVAATGIAGSQHLFGAPLSIEFSGDDLQVLGDLAGEAARLLEGVSGVREVRVSTGEGLPELAVRVDRLRAAFYGVNAAQVGAAVKTAVEGEVATRLSSGGRELDVRVFVGEEARQRVADLEYLPVPSPLGAGIPLREIALVEPGVGPVAIERSRQVRQVAVTADIVGRDLGSVTADVREKLRDLPLPAGYVLKVGGQAEQMTESFGALREALLLAIVLVYAVLAAQFESLAQPLVIMGSVPFAFVGVATGLALARKTLCVPSFIGIITLAGVVVNNAIVLVDYTNQLRRSGMERSAAIVEAGSARLRPILMTATTTLLGLFPLALGLGRGGEIQSPLAVALMGGLATSTALTLLVVPVFYTLVEDAGGWRRWLSALNWRRRR